MPYDAITLDAQNRPVVDPGLCNGCGKCEQICPANVYQAYREAACAASSCARFLPAVRAMQRATQEEA